MKNNNFNQRNKKEKREQTNGLGVIFIKSRKSEDKIRIMTDDITAIASAIDVSIEDVIIDDSFGSDINRSEIDELCFWIENSPVGVIFIKSLLDITQDGDDLKKFLNKAECFGMIIVDVDAHIILLPCICKEMIK